MTEKTTDPTQEADAKLDEQFNLLKTSFTPEQAQAIKIYRQVLKFLGIDNVVNKTNPVLYPDMIDYKSSPYISLTKDQLMYYIGNLCGIRPYLCEELTDAKARAIYSTVWRKFNEVGFKITYRRDKLSHEIEKLEKQIELKAKDAQTATKGKKAVNLGIKKHYTEENLKDESTWRNCTWAKTKVKTKIVLDA